MEGRKPGSLKLNKEEREKAMAILKRAAMKDWLTAHGQHPKPPKLHGSVMRVIQKWFDLVDADGSGGLDRSELAAALKAAGLPCDMRAIAEMVGLMDLDKNGEISWTEFEDFLAQEFADGKTLLSGEYVLPSGTALPFGAMVSKMRREKILSEVMQGGTLRAKWSNLAGNEELLTGELRLLEQAAAEQEAYCRATQLQGMQPGTGAPASSSSMEGPHPPEPPHEAAPQEEGVGHSHSQSPPEQASHAAALAEPGGGGASSAQGAPMPDGAAPPCLHTSGAGPSDTPSTATVGLDGAAPGGPAHQPSSSTRCSHGGLAGATPQLTRPSTQEFRSLLAQASSRAAQGLRASPASVRTHPRSQSSCGAAAEGSRALHLQLQPQVLLCGSGRLGGGSGVGSAAARASESGSVGHRLQAEQVSAMHGPASLVEVGGCSAGLSTPAGAGALGTSISAAGTASCSPTPALTSALLQQALASTLLQHQTTRRPRQSSSGLAHNSSSSAGRLGRQPASGPTSAPVAATDEGPADVPLPCLPVARQQRAGQLHGARLQPLASIPKAASVGDLQSSTVPHAHARTRVASLAAAAAADGWARVSAPGTTGGAASAWRACDDSCHSSHSGCGSCPPGGAPAPPAPAARPPALVKSHTTCNESSGNIHSSNSNSNLTLLALEQLQPGQHHGLHAGQHLQHSQSQQHTPLVAGSPPSFLHAPPPAPSPLSWQVHSCVQPLCEPTSPTRPAGSTAASQFMLHKPEALRARSYGLGGGAISLPPLQQRARGMSLDAGSGPAGALHTPSRLLCTTGSVTSEAKSPALGASGRLHSHHATGGAVSPVRMRPHPADSGLSAVGAAASIIHGRPSGRQ